MGGVTGYIEQSIAAHADVVESTRLLAPVIERAVELITESLESDGCVLFCGNGGSAADAQHLAAELVGRFAYDRRPLPAHALTVNTSVLTAVANDYGYDEAFARQVSAEGHSGDVLVGLSTSGRSENIVKASSAAREIGMRVIAMTGENPGPIGEDADVVLAVPSTATPRIQEAHILIGHMICGLVEEALCPR